MRPGDTAIYQFSPRKPRGPWSAVAILSGLSWASVLWRRIG